MKSRRQNCSVLLKSLHQTRKNHFDLFFSSVPSNENRFKGFDYKKLCAMVLFFAHKNPGLMKTKLLKLLNYSDMIFFKENGISISGERYVHLQYGPVPENFDLIMARMESDCIAHIEVEYVNGYEKHQVIPECNIPDGVLSDSELDVLERVDARFKDFGSADISAYCHIEKGYKMTKQGEIIIPMQKICY